MSSPQGRTALLLFPCNGNAQEALDCLDGAFCPIGFIDDDSAKVGTRVLDVPVFSRDALDRFPGAQVLAVPGGPASFPRRAEVIESLGIPERRFATIIHPRASVSRHARIGVNVLLMAGVVITANAVLDDHVVILPNSVVHHGARIRTHAMVGSGVVVAGGVDVGEGCYVGSGARLRNDVRIAPGSLIGLGSTVVRSIEEPRGVWAGSPARWLRPNRG